MASKWSKEHILFEHRDLQANTMAVDYTGRFILLGGRRNLALINIENPGTVLKKIMRQSKWEVGAAQWNPHPHCSHLFAISCNQRTEILSWESAEVITQHSLRFHTRMVSDLDWHHRDSNLIATCSADTFINIWDIRDARRPSTSVSAVVGATQVKWNKVSGNLLATAHEGDLRLWDYRKSSSPVQYIAAHLQKIHGVDWNEFQENHLATSSQDCTVKFFDVSNPRASENTLRTMCPVWKAKFTPFGQGLATTQLRRGENSVLLWNLADLSNPAHSFVGPHDVVLGLEWKKNPLREDEYNLITWSKDQNLRIWRVDSSIQKLCGYDSDADLPNIFEETDTPIFKIASTETPSRSSTEIQVGLEATEEAFGVLSSQEIISETLRLPTHKGVAVSIAAAQAVLTNTLSPTSGRKRGGSTTSIGNNSLTESKPLSEKSYQFTEEIDKLKEVIDAMPGSVKLGSVNDEKRTLTLALSASKNQAILVISLPRDYPAGAIPTINFGNGTNLDTVGRSKVTKTLKQVAQSAQVKGSPCLESLTQQALSILSSLALNETNDESLPASQTTSSSVVNSNYRYPQTFLPKNALISNLSFNQDHNIPYPRSSGARFCSAGLLICFGRPSYLRRVGSKTNEHSTPRALSVNPSGFSPSLVTHKLSAQPSASHFGLVYPPVAQSPTGDPSASISVFYNQDRASFPRNKTRSIPRSKSRFSTMMSSNEDKRSPYDVRQPKVVGVVTIYDASGLMPIHLELAQRYVLNQEDLVRMSKCNATAAACVGRKDLYNVWSLVALLTSPRLTASDDKRSSDQPWAQNPLGRKMVNSIIEHYVKQRDIQTVAMLCCVFGSRNESPRGQATPKLLWADAQRNPRWSSKESPYHTIHPGDSLVENWNALTSTKQNRSNSWSESLDDFRVPQLFNASSSLAKQSNGTSSNADTNDSKDKDFKLLEPKLNALYDNYRRCYADILYRWGLLETRALVLKHQTSSGDIHRGIDFVNECIPCRQGAVRGPQCTLCKKLLLCCSLCRVYVKGTASFCLICGHGGHALHMARWFAEENTCPTGCGCQCLLETSSVMSV